MFKKIFRKGEFLNGLSYPKKMEFKIQVNNTRWTELNYFGLLGFRT